MENDVCCSIIHTLQKNNQIVHPLKKQLIEFYFIHYAILFCVCDQNFIIFTPQPINMFEYMLECIKFNDALCALGKF